jgi:hypothetical protein
MTRPDIYGYAFALFAIALFAAIGIILALACIIDELSRIRAAIEKAHEGLQ